MRIDYTSDLHMEKLNIKNIEDYVMKQLQPLNGDFLLLNGDISDYNYEIFEMIEILNNKKENKRIKRRFKKIRSSFTNK